MPHSVTTGKGRRRSSRTSGKNKQGKGHPRYTVGLAPQVANQVQRYAERADTSVSKAISALVRIGLESQEIRKREFFQKLRDNLSNDDPSQQDRLIDEFRALILGH